MPVIQTTVMTTRPGRYDDFVASVRRSRAILQKNGATNVRLVSNLVGGADFGTFVLTAEYKDFAAAGQGLDRFLTDGEGVQLIQQSTGPDGPTQSVQSSLWIEVPL